MRIGNVALLATIPDGMVIQHVDPQDGREKYTLTLEGLAYAEQLEAANIERGQNGKLIQPKHIQYSSEDYIVTDLNVVQFFFVAMILT